MAKPMREVNRGILESCLRAVEADGPLTKQNDVYEKVAAQYNGVEGMTPITVSVVALRIKTWNLEMKTLPARKGRAGFKMTDEHKAALMAARAEKPRVSREERFAKSGNLKEAFKLMRRKAGASYASLCDKVERGSMSSAIKLHCIDCMGYDSGCSAEIRKCTSIGCALYAFRPYQHGDEEVEGEQVESSESSEVQS